MENSTIAEKGKKVHFPFLLLSNSPSWGVSFKIFNVFIVSICVCVYVNVCSHVCGYLQRPEKSIRSSEARVTGVHELFNVGSEN